MDVVGCEAGALFLSTGVRRRRRVVVLEAQAQGVFAVGKLVDKVAGVAPDGQVRVGRGRVEGRADAVLIVVVVEQISRIVVSWTGRGCEIVERDVGGPPGAARV